MIWFFMLLMTGLVTDGAKPVRHQGVCWVAGREKISTGEIDKLVRLHANWISQTPFGWQARPDQPEITYKFNGAQMWWGESDAGLIETTRLAKMRGIKTMLKPHLWTRNWPGDIAMKTADDWTRWFSFYERFILHYADLAEQSGMDMLCIGTELQQTTTHEQAWRGLISKIRSVYHGPVTYAANFHEEFERIAFWDQLDFIGVQAYFPLAAKPGSSEKELIAGWEQHLRVLQRVQSEFNKPVLFTEIGYRNTADAAVDPWKWPSQSDAISVNNQMQASCYRAFFKAVWGRPWFAGAYFWKWYPKGPRDKVDFTPQDKPAEMVLREHFQSAYD